MFSSFIEQRQHDRRHLNTPVAFYSNGVWELKKYAIGQTRDVSTRGACIRTSLGHMPEIDSSLVLMLINETTTSVRIKGKVEWVNHEAKRFGVSFS